MLRAAKLILLLNLSLWATHAQIETQRVRFDVASFKLSSTPGHSYRKDPGRIDMQGYSLGRLMQHAYGMKPFQIASKELGAGPYDLVATMPPETTKEQMEQMLQALLGERLNLRIHGEERNIPVYRLTVAPSGLRMKPSVVTTVVDDDPHRALPYQMSFEFNTRTYKIVGRLDAATLSSTLEGNLDHPVIDETGLSGQYEIDLTFYSPPRGGVSAAPSAIDEPVSAGRTAGPIGPGIASALEKQLGLKLEARRTPFNVIVIDHVDKIPVEN